jgi:phage shock protein PspC (stress-responsive transcriptional regulator)
MEKQWMRLRRDKIVGGVLSGLAWKYDLHPALPRVIALIVLIGGFPVLTLLVVLSYAFLWLRLPAIDRRDELPAPALVKGLQRPAKGRVLAGVCLGVAQQYKLEVSLVRVVMVALTVTGGVGLIAYIAGWLLIPLDSSGAA